MALNAYYKSYYIRIFNIVVGEKLMDMLASSESEVVYTSCGVLINLMLDEDKRFLLRKQENNGVSLYVSNFKILLCRYFV